MAFDRITVEPDKLEGRPCIRRLRMTVESVVRLVAAGWCFEQILEEYPDLEHEDIREGLEYAAASTDVLRWSCAGEERPRRSTNCRLFSPPPIFF